LTVGLQALRNRQNTNREGEALMPVLDAKALDHDPKGAAFLTSVLRGQALPKAAPTIMSRGERPHDHAQTTEFRMAKFRMAEVRMARRLKGLLHTDPV
jgi:hypothetical protein